MWHRRTRTTVIECFRPSEQKERISEAVSFCARVQLGRSSNSVHARPKLASLRALSSRVVWQPPQSFRLFPECLSYLSCFPFRLLILSPCRLTCTALRTTNRKALNYHQSSLDCASSSSTSSGIDNRLPLLFLSL